MQPLVRRRKRMHLMVVHGQVARNRFRLESVIGHFDFSVPMRIESMRWHSFCLKITRIKSTHRNKKSVIMRCEIDFSDIRIESTRKKSISSHRIRINRQIAWNSPINDLEGQNRSRRTCCALGLIVIRRACFPVETGYCLTDARRSQPVVAFKMLPLCSLFIFLCFMKCVPDVKKTQRKRDRRAARKWRKFARSSNHFRRIFIVLEFSAKWQLHNGPRK